jgi:hypothetical protein
MAAVACKPSMSGICTSMSMASNDDWYPPSIFFQGMKFMLFGDPTLPLATPDVGKD